MWQVEIEIVHLLDNRCSFTTETGHDNFKTFILELREEYQKNREKYIIVVFTKSNIWVNESMRIRSEQYEAPVGINKKCI
jgi:hypothetical protein